MRAAGAGGRATVIEVRDLTQRYGDKEVLHGISFTVRPGAATGYLGPNGAGKSTTMKVLTGLLRPTGGTVRVAGYDLATDPLEAKRRLGYVPESAALYASLTANEYLSMVAELYHLPRATAGDRVRQLLQVFGLTDAADRPIETYSKGMRQKVLISAALLHDPDVVLLDEPLNGLDVNAALALRRLVEELVGRGKTVLYCSHILDVVERVCSRVIVLHEGRVVADDATAALLRGAPQGTLEGVFRSLTAATPDAEWGDWKDAFFGTTPVPPPAPPAPAPTGSGGKKSGRKR